MDVSGWDPVNSIPTLSQPGLFQSFAHGSAVSRIAWGWCKVSCILQNAKIVSLFINLCATTYNFLYAGMGDRHIVFKLTTWWGEA